MSLIDGKNFEEAAEQNGCSGWRFPEDCPNEGEYNPESKACLDCCEDALKAMSEGLP